MVKEHGMSLTGDTAWVVLDEADRMLNMGFENQVGRSEAIREWHVSIHSRSAV